MADYLNIAGRIRTTASDGVTMEAQEVKDLNRNKNQQEINVDVQMELDDRYTKEETYSKEQLDDLITTPDVNYVSVVATDATTAVTDILPATGEANTIYRVGNWNGTQYDPTMYALLAWNGSAYVCLAVRSFVGEVYDVSANHPDGQGNPTPYADLAAALGTDGANIQADIRRGGMRIQFIKGTVQSSDNKYVQYRLMSDEWSTNTEDWAIADEGVYVENPEFVKVVTDNEDRILYAVKTDGDFYFGAGVPQQIIDYVIEHTDATKEELLTLIDTKVDKEEGKSLIDAEYASSIQFIENPEFAGVWLDSEEHILFGVQTDGNFLFGCGVPQQAKDYVEQKIADLSLDEKVDKVEGKSLIDEEYASTKSTIDNPEFLDVTLDNEDKILEAHEKDGTKLFETDVKVKGGIETSAAKTSNHYTPEYINAEMDSEGKVLSGTKPDGSHYIHEVESETIGKNAFLRKRISIIGDSISTFNGYDAGILSLYPQEDVTSVGMTWWMKFIEATESVLEKNVSISGKRATKSDDGFALINYLGNPSLIFVELGTNDAKEGVAVDIGTFDYDSDNLDTTKFAPAYINGLKNIIDNYPYATIVCMIFEMGDAYADAIKQIATHYNAAYFDARPYIEGKMHPNKKGMDAVCSALIRKIRTELILSDKTGTFENSYKVKTTKDSEFINAETDSTGKVLAGRTSDGTKVEKVGIETPSISVDGEIHKGFYDPDNNAEIKTDAERRILSSRDKNGVLHEYVGIESSSILTNSLNLTEKGMSDFQKALKDSGMQNGGRDFSNTEIVELPEPKHYSILNLIVPKLPIEDNEVIDGFAEYYDFFGNYFRKAIKLESQGQTSKTFARTGGKGNYTIDLDDGSEIKFGSWVPQDSFHLKGNAKDVTRGVLPTSYKLAWKVMNYLDAKPNRVLMDEASITTIAATGDRITDWPTDARCLPDGFPCEVYVNGEYWGLYSWQLKKHRKNYSMNKKDYKSFFIDADNLGDFWLGDIPWTQFEIKNPKDLVCMDGSAYDGDNPKELIDETAVGIYDATNKKHKGSKQTKDIIKSFPTKYLEIKSLIDNNDLVQAKTKFAEYFDVNACMLVYIFNCTMANHDSVNKNTLWGTYSDGKIAPMLWDLDGMYGLGWIGYIASAPSAAQWTGLYANSEWPLALFWTLYETEIKAAYTNLRRDGIISMDTWRSVIYDSWVNRVGTEAYERDIEKWHETPSYRENYTNTEYWRQDGRIYDMQGYSLWDENTEYSAGDVVLLYMNAEHNYMQYTAIQGSTGVCPVTKFYEQFPSVGGFYDSPKRMEKWMEEQIRLCDIKLNYNQN